ncbi:MAG: DUF5615 family PIN-like protein [Rhodocyclaceae bacterium]
MKLLLDQNLSRRLLADLEALFPGSAHVQLLGMESASDMELWRFAAEERYAILTKDVDFLEIQLVRGYPPKIVWLNCGNVSNVAVRTRLLANAEAIRCALQDDEIGVVEID